MQQTGHETHEGHDHRHDEGCGHRQIRHEDHVDYLHDGHLHSSHGDHVDEHVLTVSERHPQTCEAHSCEEHGTEHVHGDACGHDSLPHGDHRDYVVGDHLHHQHGEHCDDHGRIG